MPAFLYNACPGPGSISRGLTSLRMDQSHSMCKRSPQLLPKDPYLIHDAGHAILRMSYVHLPSWMTGLVKGRRMHRRCSSRQEHLPKAILALPEARVVNADVLSILLSRPCRLPSLVNGIPGKGNSDVRLVFVELAGVQST